MNKLVKSLLIIDATLLSIAGLFGFIGYMTNGYASAEPLYIRTADGVAVSSLALPEGEELGVQVVGTGTNKTPEYVIAISPNAENDFTFRADGAVHRFTEVKSLNDAFELKTETGQFTLQCKPMAELLSAYYGGAEIELPTGIKTNVTYFNLTYSKADGSYGKTVCMHYFLDDEE